MSKDIKQLLDERRNDYGPLEREYLSATGAELVTDPHASLMNLEAGGGHSLSASVVIPAWNAAGTIVRCLRAIESCSFNSRYPDQLEVIVVDDGSSDGTWEVLESTAFELRLRVIRQEHGGRARGMNAGMSIAEGDVIISCDADMVLNTFTVEELVKRHALLEGVILVGFRRDVPPDDARIKPALFPGSLKNRATEFYGDDRVTFYNGGWPESMCRDSAHLKGLGGGRCLWMPGEEIPYDLPRTVYGALYSMRRPLVELIGGHDECFEGWGWEDTAFAARAIAAGNFVIPVYSASGLHISHPERSPNQHVESALNHRRYNDILRSPADADRGHVLPAARKRISKYMERGRAGLHDLSHPPVKVSADALNGGYERGVYLHTLGRYTEAVEVFAEAAEEGGERGPALFNAGKSLYSLRRFTEALEAFELAAATSADEAPALAMMGLTYAATGDFAKALSYTKSARRHDPQNALPAYVLNTPPDSHLRRGLDYAKQGTHLIAVKDFEAALINDPSNARARREREKSLSLLA